MVRIFGLCNLFLFSSLFGFLPIGEDGKELNPEDYMDSERFERYQIAVTRMDSFQAFSRLNSLSNIELFQELCLAYYYLGWVSDAFEKGLDCSLFWDGKVEFEISNDDVPLVYFVLFATLFYLEKEYASRSNCVLSLSQIREYASEHLERQKSLVSC